MGQKFASTYKDLLFHVHRHFFHITNSQHINKVQTVSWPSLFRLSCTSHSSATEIIFYMNVLGGNSTLGSKGAFEIPNLALEENGFGNRWSNERTNTQRVLPTIKQITQPIQSSGTSLLGGGGFYESLSTNVGQIAGLLASVLLGNLLLWWLARHSGD